MMVFLNVKNKFTLMRCFVIKFAKRERNFCGIHYFIRGNFHNCNYIKKAVDKKIM